MTTANPLFRTYTLLMAQDELINHMVLILSYPPREGELDPSPFINALRGLQNHNKAILGNLTSLLFPQPQTNNDESQSQSLQTN